MPRPNDVGVGVAVVLKRDGKVLLLCRQGSHAAGTWAVPGGWIDRTDPHPFNVVQREALEEMGVTVHDAVLVGVTSENHTDFRSVTLYYLATRWQGEPRICEPEKCSAIMWHPLSAPPPAPMFPGLDEGLKYVKTYLEFGA